MGAAAENDPRCCQWKQRCPGGVLQPLSVHSGGQSSLDSLSKVCFHPHLSSGTVYFERTRVSPSSLLLPSPLISAEWALAVVQSLAYIRYLWSQRKSADVSSLANDDVGSAVYSNAKWTSWTRSWQLSRKCHAMLHVWAEFEGWQTDMWLDCQTVHAVCVNGKFIDRAET